MNEDVKYMLQQMQLQKTIGELNALVVSCYDPMGNNDKYREVKKIVDSFINELTDHIG